MKSFTMKDGLRGLATIVVATVVGMAAAEATPITYSIVNNAPFQSGYAVSGSITTDGTIGNLSGFNITSWTWTIKDASNNPVATLSGGNPPDFEGVVASATQILLPAPNGARHILELAAPYPVHTPELGWIRRPGSNDPEFGFPASNLYVAFSSGGTQLWYTEGSPLISTQDGAWIVAETPVAPVPEIDPASFGSALSLVLGALGLAERKRRVVIG